MTTTNATADTTAPHLNRRTFAIISHPDAGKTTLTEKLLYFGGAIQLAGEVRAKQGRRQTSSDWMKIERQRGISVVTSVMTFDYGGCVYNLLDTPGHEDFSEDTYRTLTAVDSAVMVIDAAKGIEARTRKLFEVCRLRDIPIITFVNKVDRETRDPFDLIQEIEQMLALEVAPMTWPVGRGRDFVATYDIAGRLIRRNDRGEGTDAAERVSGPHDRRFDELIPGLAGDWRDEVMLAAEGTKPFDLKSFREGHQTPLYWGAALRDYGVRDLIEALKAYAPSPRDQAADKRVVSAGENKLSGFVFKIQANTDPNHRDRIAFFRVCSGTLKRGMKAMLTRTAKPLPLNAPQFFFAQERSLADEAVAGDIVGIPNHGTLRIGDTLTEGEGLRFKGVPSFAPEILRRVKLKDPMKAKKLKEALQQMGEEGVVQVFTPHDGAPAIVGVVGALQLDVLKERMESEYSIPIEFDQTQFNVVRWVSAENRTELDKFVQSKPSSSADDLDGDPVYMASSAFSLKYDAERAPAISFTDVKDYQKG